MALVYGMQVSLFTQVNGNIQIGWNIKEGSYSELRKQSFTHFIDQLVKAFPQLEEAARSHIQSWNDFVLLDVHSSFGEQWNKAGIALIGDAVHTMTPTGAFGLNCALKDADILASIIDPEYISELDLISCASMRKKEIEKLQAIQIEKEQSFASQFMVFA